MTTALLKDGFPSAHHTTRQRIESSIDLRRLFRAIDSDPALIGAGVVYIDELFNVVVLREFQPICRVQPIKVVLREAPTHRNDAFAAALGLTGSSMTGNTKTLAVGIYEELSE